MSFRKDLFTAETESLSFSSTEEVEDDQQEQQQSLEKNEHFQTNTLCNQQRHAKKVDGTRTSPTRRANNNTSYIQAMLTLLSNSWTQFRKDGQDFRRSLTTQDVQKLKFARSLFHSCSVLPALLYYMGTVERPAKFPATISFTIRKGLPKHVQTLLWVSGWTTMGRIIQRAGSKFIRKFCLKMFLTGVWTTQLFRLGQGPLSDVAHFGGAAIYMLDHAALFEILNTKPLFRKIFYSSFVALVVGCGGTRAMEIIAGLPMESDSDTSTADRARRLSNVNAKVRRKLFLWELLVMVSENLLFASFVQGMPSGILDDADDANNNDELKECKKKITMNRLQDLETHIEE